MEKHLNQMLLDSIIPLLASIALLGSPSPAISEPSSQIHTIKVEAPDDIYITQLLVPQGGSVDANQPLLTLQSPMLDYWRISLDAQNDQISLSNQKFTDKRADERIKMLAVKAAELLSAKNASHQKVAAYLRQSRSGIGPDPGPSGTGATIFEASRQASKDDSAFAEADLIAKQEDRVQKEEKDKIAIQQRKQLAQEALYHQLLDRLTVKASHAGTFTSYVGPGDFVKKGHLLGEIKY